jgi:hypothetical protein
MNSLLLILIGIILGYIIRGLMEVFVNKNKAKS